MADFINMSELEFENEVVDYLTKIGDVKQWEYKKEIKTTDQLWDNFKAILEQNNKVRINDKRLPGESKDGKLTHTEFNQVKKIINEINSPYEAGQFLYGINGKSQIEIDLDNGNHVYLTVFDQDQIGGGNTVYHIVNQIERPKIIDGKPNRRFDVTMLINGLPIIQIELKKTAHSTMEALNQMEQYIAEKQYSGIFSTLQILVAMTPYDIRYMANTKLETFNKDFAFRWQYEDDAHPVNSWKTFADQVLSIPMAHELATRYMILDGTKNKESIKVMRPYQVYATKRVLDQVRKHDFSYGDGKLGYIWHTTGSGKTITSFKTAWLTSRLPNVSKVIFLVDRVALTNQTTDAYRAYDPAASSESQAGVINDTANVLDLKRKLTKQSDQNIIVTSIQKMSKYVSSRNFKAPKGNILFIVDEAHRSTGDGSDGTAMLERIRKAIPQSAWVGYTGTPKFPETREIFGSILHAYTIKEAIADKNVLGFKVEFKETIAPPKDPSEEDIDDQIKGSVYDYSPEHVELVVQDIFDNWKKRSNNGKYNALFTVHVGGGRVSTPRAMEYFDKFAEINATKPEEDRLKVGISFSMDTSNHDHQLTTNNNLHRAIKAYNKQFGTAFDLTSHKEYREDLARRLNKSADDKQFLDLVIVVDQLLTGFDAPELNTLYIDRTLKGGNLIQAYSRTNRMHKLQDKPWGNVVNYRWPKENEKLMNKAFRLYANRDSATKKEESDTDTTKGDNVKDGIIAKPFSQVQAEVKEVVEKLAKLTDGFQDVPASERAKEETFEALKEYNRLVNQLKQYTEDDDKNPVSAYDDELIEDFYDRIGITQEQEVFLTTVIADRLKRERAQKEDIDISQVDLEMVHIHDVIINYDYLADLIAKMADEVKADEMDKAKTTYDDIQKEIAKEDNEKQKARFTNFVDKIYKKEYEFPKYPVPHEREVIYLAMDESEKQSNTLQARQFIQYWGIDNSINPKELLNLIQRHRYGQDDLDKQHELTNMMNDARKDYPEMGHPDVAKLNWLGYRKGFRQAIYELADEIKKNE